MELALLYSKISYWWTGSTCGKWVLGLIETLSKLNWSCSSPARLQLFILRPSQGIFSLVDKVIVQQLLLILQQLTFQFLAFEPVTPDLWGVLDIRKQQSRKVPRWMGSLTSGIHNHKRTIFWGFIRFSYSKVLILYSVLLYWPYLDTGVPNSLVFFLIFDFQDFPLIPIQADSLGDRTWV